jgi:hypothetical protein
MIMDLISQAAVSHLETVLTGYLPPVSSGSVNRDVLIVPKRIKPLGLGAYVGMHDDPSAEIYGRSVEATAEFRISRKGNDLSAINSEISSLTTALLATDRSTLRNDGIYILKLDELSSPTAVGNGNARTATFTIHYEYQDIPSQAGGVIDEIVLKDLLNPSDGPAGFLVNMDARLLDGLVDPLADFLSVTDTNINVSSPAANWVYNSPEKRIEQRNATRGGSLSLNNSRKAGAQLILQPGGNPLAIKNGAIRIKLSSTDPDGIGCVFRWQDVENFYYFLMSDRNDYQIFGKKVGGSFSFLAEGGQSNLDTIQLDDPHELRVIALGDRFQAYLNDQLVCEGVDGALADAGQMGFLSHGNSAAFFYGMDVIEFP